MKVRMVVGECSFWILGLWWEVCGCSVIVLGTFGCVCFSPCLEVDSGGCVVVVDRGQVVVAVNCGVIFLVTGVIRFYIYLTRIRGVVHSGVVSGCCVLVRVIHVSGTVRYVQSVVISRWCVFVHVIDGFFFCYEALEHCSPMSIYLWLTLVPRWEYSRGSASCYCVVFLFLE